MEKGYFKSLDTNSKTELTWNYGELMRTVETTDYYITLLLLGNFYVEIYIDKANSELISINLQDDPDILYHYISDLDIHEIVEH